MKTAIISSNRLKGLPGVHKQDAARVLRAKRADKAHASTYHKLNVHGRHPRR